MTEKALREKSLRTSIKEGASASVMLGLGDSYIAPYAIAVGASAPEIAILASIPNLLGGLSQLSTTKLMERRSRKTVTTKAVLAQALMWLPIIGSIFLYSKELRFIPLLIILLWTIYLVCGNSGAPAWLSWMGDIVPEDKRGRYFGLRNTICNSVLLTATLLGAVFLDYLKKRNLLFLGFGTLFFLAMTFRLISAFLLTKQYEPELKVDKNYYFSFLQFVKGMKGNNFGRFAIFVMLIHTSTFIAAPFFAPYMLRDLKFNYLLFILVATVSNAFVQIVTPPIWGRASDRFGNVMILKISTVLVSMAPIMWLFSSNPYYLIFLPSIIAGSGWAGFGLTASNFIYDAVGRQRRGYCFAYYNVLNGIGIFIGATIGGWITKLPIHFMNIFLFTFLLSGILRFVTLLGMIPNIKEIRIVQRGAPA